ncbi:MAG: adenylate/guanylate cyclase domain-containing protein [Gammaproteobacteria bacterium]|nr:adenylate/guanylate cyclase domain-containing protein [Gammaproteobacteria bacterium]
MIDSSDNISDLTNWLLDTTFDNYEVATLVSECSERLITAGIPLSRVFFSYTILHPLYSSKSVAWQPGAKLDHESYAHGAEESDDWLQSPFYHMVENDLNSLRRRLSGSKSETDFPILKQFQSNGLTDYLAFAIKLGEINGKTQGILGSWSTDDPDGFTDEHIEILTGVQRYLGVACNAAIKVQISKNVALAYLGSTAGLEVLEGRIRRGDYEIIRAVIWMSDMRDSTQLAEKHTYENYLDLLNQYFESTAGPLMANGGQVLSFIGDAVLGIFPVGDNHYTKEDASTRAIEAAITAQSLRSEMTNTPRYGIALHYGDVMFGNIGVPERLSFSVVGSAVNEVSRLETLTKELNEPVLVSQQFAKHSNINWMDKGIHTLRGVSQPIQAFAPGR